MDSNKKLLKQVTQGKGSERKSAGITIPGLETIKKSFGKASAKQVIDVVLFSAGIYLMYKFGKSAADTIDGQMPTEKSMMEMMKSMQGGPGMPPPPMYSLFYYERILNSNNMNNSFFQEVYANYNQIWQQVLKLTLINNTFVDQKSFIKIMSKVGIEVDNPMCQFLLQACSKSDGECLLIDYKQFLNSALKALSQEQFDSENFLIDQFWRIKFGESSNMQQVSIDEFNSAFYQFFKKESKLLSIDYIEQIINECFSYLLKKNKKVISKRTLKKVIKRHFRDIFHLIMFNVQQRTIKHGQNTQWQTQMINEGIPKEETLGGYINTTYYPDSLEGRSKRLTMGTTNPLKSLHETSTFQNLSKYARSKSNERLNHGYSLNQQSSYDMLAQKVGILATFDVKQSATQSLLIAIEKIQERMNLTKGMKLLKRFKGHHRQRSSKQQLREKENQVPNTKGSHRDMGLNMMGTSMSSRRKSQYERETFSFNNCQNNFLDDRLEEAFEQYQHSQQKAMKFQMTSPSHEQHQEVEPQQFRTLTNHHNSVQHQHFSNASLQYSTTPQSQGPQNLMRQESQTSQREFARLKAKYKTNNHAQMIVSQKPKCDTTRYPALNHFQVQGHSQICETQGDYSVSNNDYSLRELEQQLCYVNSSQLNSHCQSTKRSNSNSRLRLDAPPLHKTAQVRNSLTGQTTTPSQNIQPIQYNEENLRNPSIIKSVERLLYIQQNQKQLQAIVNKTLNPFDSHTIEHNSLLTDITPIPHSTHKHFDQSSITRTGDMNTLYDTTTKPRKSKEVVYFEKKYKKSKEKIRSLLGDKVNEQTKNQALQKCNTVLGEKVEQLEQQLQNCNHIINEQHELNNELQDRMKGMEIEKSIKVMMLIDRQLNMKEVQRSFVQWKISNVQMRYQDNEVKKLMFKSQLKLQQHCLQAWIKYCLSRKTRKEKRKIFKIKCKAIKLLFQRKDKLQKRKAFNIWKGPFLKSFIIQEVQRDMQLAHQQVKMMRFVLSLNKLMAFFDKRDFRQKVTAYGLLKSGQFTPCMNQKLRSKSSDNFRSQNRVTSPTQQQRLNSGKVSSFLQQPSEFGRRLSIQKQQQNVIEGIEKVYMIVRRQNQKVKRNYLRRWYNIIQQQQELEQQQQEITLSPQPMIYQDYSGDLDGSQEYILSSQSMLQPAHMQAYEQYTQQHSLNVPCYYKTNEGYFNPNPQQSFFSPSQRISQMSTKQRLNFSSRSSSANHLPDNINNSQTNLIPQIIVPKPYPLTKAPSQSNKKKDRSNNNSSAKKKLNQKNRSFHHTSFSQSFPM